MGPDEERKTDEGEPSALERISRGKEFRTMLQLMRIKPRRIYHAAADTPCCLFDFAPLPARDGSTGFTKEYTAVKIKAAENP